MFDIFAGEMWITEMISRLSKQVATYFLSIDQLINRLITAALFHSERAVTEYRAASNSYFLDLLVLFIKCQNIVNIPYQFDPVGSFIQPTVQNLKIFGLLSFMTKKSIESHV